MSDQVLIRVVPWVKVFNIIYVSDQLLMGMFVVVSECVVCVVYVCCWWMCECDGVLCCAVALLCLDRSMCDEHVGSWLTYIGIQIHIYVWMRIDQMYIDICSRVFRQCFL